MGPIIANEKHRPNCDQDQADVLVMAASRHERKLRRAMEEGYTHTCKIQLELKSREVESVASGWEYARC